MVPYPLTKSKTKRSFVTPAKLHVTTSDDLGLSFAARGGGGTFCSAPGGRGIVAARPWAASTTISFHSDGSAGNGGTSLTGFEGQPYQPPWYMASPSMIKPVSS